MKLFLSYSFNDPEDKVFVSLVCYYLSKQENYEPYCWAIKGHANAEFTKQLKKALSESDVYLLFLGSKLGETQREEAIGAFYAENIKYRIVIKPTNTPFPESLRNIYGTCPSVPLMDYSKDLARKNIAREDAALNCAIQIVGLLGTPWVPIDGVPSNYLFDYEKSIIEEFVKYKGILPGERIEQGCPKEWPKVEKREGQKENPIKESKVGLYRDWDYNKKERKSEEPEVIPAALSEYHSECPIQLHMTFPEAGPRKFLYYPTKNDGRLTVGVLVSGGIAPGINSVIYGIVERQHLYAREGKYYRTLKVLGYLNGFDALLQDGDNHRELDANFVAERANIGGSMIGSSRTEELVDTSPSKRAQALEKVARRLMDNGVEILFIIGGHGSMRAAHAIWKTAQELGKKAQAPGKQLSVVAVPKTMDNDILWVWQSFGFMSAVERAKELIGYMNTEVRSNPGLCVIQLFGSDSGFVPSHAVLSSGECDLCLIPEVPFTMKGVSRYVTQRLQDTPRTESPHSIIVMSEAAVPKDAEDYLKDPNVGLTSEEQDEIKAYLKSGRLPGHTPDALRQGTLKIVSRVLHQKIQKMEGEHWKRFRIITNEPKHQIRAIAPSCSDTIFGRRLGSLAVDCAMAGYTDFMISQWLTEYVMVPLRLVILGRKRVPKKGIFWNSVRDSTGQPEDLEE